MHCPQREQGKQQMMEVTLLSEEVQHSFPLPDHILSVSIS